MGFIPFLNSYTNYQLHEKTGFAAPIRNFSRRKCWFTKFPTIEMFSNKIAFMTGENASGEIIRTAYHGSEKYDRPIVTATRAGSAGSWAQGITPRAAIRHSRPKPPFDGAAVHHDPNFDRRTRIGDLDGHCRFERAGTLRADAQLAKQFRSMNFHGENLAVAILVDIEEEFGVPAADRQMKLGATDQATRAPGRDQWRTGRHRYLLAEEHGI